MTGLDFWKLRHGNSQHRQFFKTKETRQEVSHKI